ncbi:hypothetical protein K457DRAFT_139552 [Linnemannia elongata AG-77]|uniref:PARP catalytic domain-containing protein n=1 Tax=Linnemannia elongata AG-77 TaxID=1314771 RepID=A0A197JSJ8_9FUNG|nr:hypothetical protein K457DRAFT_139552 [Linnemannia elongata AG-77]
MTIQGVYLEPIRKETIEFQDIDHHFESKLVVLYEIIYAETVNGYLGSEDEWDGTTYCHGTSHCGCIDTKIANSQDDRIPVYAWCESAHCCTKGIIKSGFLKAKSSQGHVFSQQVGTARAMAISKTFGTASESPLLSIFVCVAKNPQNAVTYGFGAYHTVLNDNEILPVYIAIISK